MAELQNSSSAATENENNSNKTLQGKSSLENMSREDLLKQVKKQLALLQKLKAKCDESDKKCLHLKNTLEQKNEELSSQTEQLKLLDQLKESNSSLEAELQKFKDDQENYAKKHREMTEELECRRMKEESISAAIKQMQTELVKLSAENQILNSQKETISKELLQFEDLSENHLKLKEKFELVQEECANSIREHEEYKRNLEAATKKFEALSTRFENEKAEFEVRIENLEKDKAALLEQSNRLQETCELLQNEIRQKEAAESEAKRLREENEDLNEMLNESLKRNEALKEEILTVSRVSNDNNANEGKERISENKETQFSDEFGEEADLQNELQELYSRIRVLEMELQNAVEERDHLLFQEEREQKDCIMLQDRVHSLEMEIDDLKGKLESSDFEVEELRAKLEECELENREESKHFPLVNSLCSQSSQTVASELGVVVNGMPITVEIDLNSNSQDALVDKSYVTNGMKVSEQTRSVPDIEKLLVKSENEDLIEAEIALREVINEIGALIKATMLDETSEEEPSFYLWLKNVYNVLLRLTEEKENVRSEIVSKEQILLETNETIQEERRNHVALKETITSLEADLQSYKEKNDKIIEEKQLIEDDFNRLKQMDLKHEEQLLEQSFEIKNLKDKLDERNTELDSAFKELEQKRQELEDGAHYVDKLKKERDVLEENVEVTRKELEELRLAEQRQSRVAKEASLEELGRLNSTVSSLECLNAEKGERIDELQRQVSKLEEEQTSLSETLSRRFDSFHSMQRGVYVQIKSLSRCIGIPDYDNQKSETTNVASEISSDEELEKFFSQLDDDAKTETLFKAIAEVQGNLTAREKLNMADSEKLTRKEELIKKLEEQLSMKDAELQKLWEKIKEFENGYNEAVSRIDTLSLEMENQQAQIEELSTVKHTQTVQLDELSSSCASLKDESRLHVKLKEELQMEIAKNNSIIANLEATVDELQSEVHSANKSIQVKESALQDLESKVGHFTSRQKELEEELRKEKETHAADIKKLETLEKEAKQQSLMNLEFADYERLVTELNQQIEEKSKSIAKITEDLQQQKDINDSLHTQLEQAEAQFEQSESRGNKLKVLLVKTKKELNDTKRQMEELHIAEAKLQAEIELRQQTLESLKVENSELLSQFQKLQESFRATKEAHQRTVRIFEQQIATLKTQVSNIEEEYKKCQSDYENYKIRVHSVLKQKKDKEQLNNGAEEERQEKEHLEKLVEQLKLKLQEANEQLQATAIESTSYQEEYERLLHKYSDLQDEMQKKEEIWKEDFEQLLEKNSACTKEHLETIKSLHQQNDALRLNFKDQLENLREEHQKVLDHERLQLAAVEAELARLQDEQQKITPTRELEVFDVTNIERQEGEGSENTEPAFGSKPHLDSVSSMLSFEQLLNADTKSVSSQISVGQPEVETAEEQLAATVKKLQHLTEVLNESEASNIRLAEQTQVLKEEIRRIERNQERKELLGDVTSSLEYLKNVVLKFITLEGGDEKNRLVPVLTMLLQLSQEERNMLQAVTQGSVENPKSDSSRWGNYLPRWSGLV